MTGICDDRPDGNDRLGLALWLADQQEFVNASFLFAGLGLRRLTPAQLVCAGEAHFRAGHATKARACFRDAVRAFRRAQQRVIDDAELYCWLARAYGYLALYSSLPLRVLYAHRSRRYAERVLALNPRHAFACYVLALWHQRMPAWIGGRIDRVDDQLDRAIEYDGGRITFRLARARWNLKRGARQAAHHDLCVVASLPVSDLDDDRRKIEALDLLAQMPD